jgi:hypothetical protein
MRFPKDVLALRAYAVWGRNNFVLVLILVVNLVRRLPRLMAMSMLTVLTH